MPNIAREYLTEREVERLMKAAGNNRRVFAALGPSRSRPWPLARQSTYRGSHVELISVGWRPLTAEELAAEAGAKTQ